MSFAATAGLVTAGMTAAEIAAAAAAASAAATAAGTTAATAGGLLGGVSGAAAAMPSMASLAASTAAGTPLAEAGLGGLLGSAGSALGSAGTATMGLNAAKNLISDGPMQPAQMRQGSPAGPQTVAQIYQSGQEATQNQLDKAAQERMQRRQMWG